MSSQGICDGNTKNMEGGKGKGWRFRAMDLGVVHWVEKGYAASSLCVVCDRLWTTLQPEVEDAEYVRVCPPNYYTQWRIQDFWHRRDPETMVYDPELVNVCIFNGRKVC